jgi:hypothetical protein
MTDTFATLGYRRPRHDVIEIIGEKNSVLLPALER